MGVQVNVKINKNNLPSLDELTSDVQNATESEFRKVAQRLFSLVNKRIKRIQGANVISPALRMLDKKRDGNVHFSSRYSFEELKKEYAQAYAFYQLDTGTLTGARKFTNKLQNLAGERIKDKDYIAKVFDTLHSVSERVPNEIFKGKIGTNEILQQIIESEEVSEGSIFEMTEKERDDYISRQVQLIAERIKSMEDQAVEDLAKGIENAFNEMW